MTATVTYFAKDGLSIAEFHYEDNIAAGHKFEAYVKETVYSVAVKYDSGFRVTRINPAHPDFKADYEAEMRLVRRENTMRKLRNF